jgi:hypothetical protein
VALAALGRCFAPLASRVVDGFGGVVEAPRNGSSIRCAAVTGRSPVVVSGSAPAGWWLAPRGAQALPSAAGRRRRASLNPQTPRGDQAPTGVGAVSRVVPRSPCPRAVKGSLRSASGRPLTALGGCTAARWVGCRHPVALQTSPVLHRASPPSDRVPRPALPTPRLRRARRALPRRPRPHPLVPRRANHPHQRPAQIRHPQPPHLHHPQTHTTRGPATLTSGPRPRGRGMGLAGEGVL